MQYTTEQVQQWAVEGQAVSPRVVLEILEEYRVLLADHEAMLKQLNEFARWDVEPKYLAWPASEFAQKARGTLSTLRFGVGSDAGSEGATPSEHK